ncbi:MAG: glycosyl hydrolase [Bacteroidota bacterium]
MRFTLFSFLLLLSLVYEYPAAQAQSFPESQYSSLEWRSIGPFRGGRSATVTGVPGQANLYYMGAAGGGVWRTQDGGQTWVNISDGSFGGSIGAVAVSESDHNVIYVGGGEVTVRGNVSYGYGMHKSVDAGKNWRHIGLPNSRHITRIRVHPQNPDLVYAAVLGDLFKAHEQRGVYRSKDGGENWEKVLFANADAGAVDLIMDPNNPRILYASTWRIRRTPYSLESGGEGSALWKSTDGGDTWTDISSNKGLPTGDWGISGVTVSPVNSERVWAIIENEKGGVYRSDDGGENWQRVNESRALRQRAWYYSRIYADTQDEDIVYVMNVRYHKSTDGGATFEAFNAPHGDHHDLWIAPEDNQRMVIADDGGAQVSFDGGSNWSTYLNQPTAQFYRVTTDDHFPYRIYGAQQDNSTVRISHRGDGAYLSERNWEPTAGGESAHITIDPTDNDIVYGGSYGGYLTRVNHRTKQEQAINVWPDNPMGHGAEGMKYRFQWNFPVFFSPHNPQRLYTTSNHVHVSEDGGQSWEIISPDLTRNDPSKLVSSGGPITKDNTGVEYYCTIFAAVESPHAAGEIWAGSDDGLLHLTRDGGKNWTNITPKGMPEWMMINSIDLDAKRPGRAYVAGTRYKLGDYAPYLYRTDDYGKNWTKITNGIDAQHFTRVLRADPERTGLLYAGTETGMYISFDDGNNWQPFQLNLPIVPITDLTIKNNNLIAATQGRSFWIIDDLTVLHQQAEDLAKKDFHLFQPIDSYRMGGRQGKPSRRYGANHPGGVTFHYNINEAPADSVPVSLSIYEANGQLVRTYSSDAKEKGEQLKFEEGGNTFNWNLRYPEGTKFDGMIMWWAGVGGPKAKPGDYQVELKVGEETQRQDFTILADPRSEATEEDIAAQFDFMKDVQDKVSQAHQAIIDLRDIKAQVGGFVDRLPEGEQHAALREQAKSLQEELTAVEESLYQTQNRSRQDPLNFPVRLTNKLAHLNSLVGIGDFRPTAQAYAVKEEMETLIDEELATYRRVVSEDLPTLNRLIRESQIDLIQGPKAKP